MKIVANKETIERGDFDIRVIYATIPFVSHVFSLVSGISKEFFKFLLGEPRGILYN